MSQKYQKLKELLKTLFQLDQPDLDFGLYRIMHAKSTEITQFLDHDLLPQVKQAFSQYQPADKAEIQKALDLAVEQARALGADPDALPKVKELRERLANEAVDLSALESEVYDHLYSFFRRYYDDGDFLSKRVYKQGVYAIPYEGEETKFTWANQDQYYIKTSEYLRDYAFRLRPDDADPMRVHFRLVDAAEGEHGNVKAAEGKERLFVLAPNADTGHDFIRIVPGENGNAAELQISFEYRPATLTDWPESEREGKKNPPKQENLRSIAVERILGVQAQDLLPWIAELAKPHARKDGSQADFSRLQAHLDGYTKRNTFDYFIHKDLGRFLLRELDFYIKNEMMHLDDIESESAPRVEQYLSKIKVVRTIAGKIIDFIAQLEDFQKKLWLKKKFVVETSYLISLQYIPDELLPQVASNEAQTEDWITQFGIDDVPASLMNIPFSRPLTIEFLKANRNLILDTKFFTQEFVNRFLDLNDGELDRVDGTLIHSDNFHALSLIRRAYYNQVDCIYIDPPYNTGDSEILYKNSYKHSSWLSLIRNRLEIAKSLLADDPTLFVAIDDYEMAQLCVMMDESLPDMRREMVIVNHHPQGGKGAVLANTHEYMLTFVKVAGERKLVGRSDDEAVEHRPFKRSGTAESNFRRRRQNSFYAILVDPATRQVRGLEPPPNPEDDPYPTNQTDEGYIRVYPIGEDGSERVWRRSYESCGELVTRAKFFVSENYTIYQLLEPHEKTSALFSNWVDPRYNAGTHGANLLRDILGEQNPFSYPKSFHTVYDALFASQLEENSIVLDFFGGSGTTAHAVIALNRDDGVKRSFVLAEAEDYFDSVIVPRVKRVAYCPKWSDGKPKGAISESEIARGPKIVKILRLESYEDALNNLEPRRSQAQQDLLIQPESQGQDGFKEQFLLKYMLNVETRGSQSLLNVKAFADPTAYKLLVKRPGTDESREVNVDLLETFNWLVGLRVKHIAAPQSFAAEFERDTEDRLRLRGRMTLDANGPWWFRRVEGTTPDGRNTLIVWRKLTGNPEQDNLMLDSWMKDRLKISTRDFEFDLIYVNGDNNLENLKLPDDTWKVRLIEEDFHRLMFDTEGI